MSRTGRDIGGAFEPGDQVLVRSSYPPGHRRTPYYIRGRSGTVARALGCFRNAEEAAYGLIDGSRKAIYRVRFRQRDVWQDYSGTPVDDLYVDIYEHWLVRA